MVTSRLLPLSKDEVSEQLRHVPAWNVVDQVLSRSFEFPTYVDALAMVNRIAVLAEEHGHHPDLHWSFRKITIEITTHDAGGLTARDFALAADLDRLLR